MNINMKKRKNKFKTVVYAVIVVLAAAAAVAFTVDFIGAEKISAIINQQGSGEDFREDNKPLSEENYNMLGDTQKKAYRCILNNIKNHPEYIKVPNLSQSEFSEVYFAVKNDNPNLLCFSDSCSMVTFGSMCMLQLHYDYDKAECNEKSEQLRKEADRIISEMPHLDSDYEKELYIHDYIVKNCTYEETDDASNAYGCLVKKEAVCSGYARAAMLLLEKTGVKTMLISGTGESKDSGKVGHMWNIVTIDGRPYHLDVTWDDPASADGDNTTHLYFNLTTEAISADHSDFSVDIQCVDTKFNYFVHENILFDSYSSDVISAVCEKLAENIDAGKNNVEFMFSDEASYAKAVASIIDNSSPKSDMYKIIEYVNTHAADKIDMTHVNFSKDDNKKFIKIEFDAV